MDLSNPILYIKLTGLLIAIISILVIIFPKEKWEKYSKTIFFIFIIPTMLSTLYLAGHTVNHNIHSETGGPIHWHADYQVWTCGNQLDLINPKGIANKVGSPLFHEHNDNRIHVEGTVANMADIDLESFFKVIGGELTSNKLVYPIEGGEIVSYETGDLCNGEVGELKVYVNGQSIDNIETYMYYPHALMPPGDCIIVEFGVNLPDKTTRICTWWESAEWNYENYKELRKEKGNGPSWVHENWKYVDGEGLIEVNK